MDRRQVLRAALLGGSGVLLGCGTRGPVARRERDGPAGPADGTGDDAGATGGVDTSPGGDPGPPAVDGEGPAGVDERAQPPARAPRIEVLCRDALGLAPAAATAAGGHTLDRVMLHHTGVALEADRLAPERLRLHQQAHQRRGWHDIAYHYGIDRAGHVYELRDPAEVGDTGTDYDPTGALLLVCEGDFDRQTPTDSMLAAVAGLVADGVLRSGLPVATLVGHRDETITACPGDRLYARLDEVRDEAAALVAQRPPAVVEVCGDEARARVAAIEAG